MGKKMQTVLDLTPNAIGSAASVPTAPAAGTSAVTYTLTVPAGSNELSDPTNTVRIDVWADCGTGPRRMKVGAPWTGGPGKAAPATSWQFDPAYPPVETFAVLHKITQVPAGLAVAYS